MAQKRGKGGYGSENYDPETGRYVKDDKNQYHAGANISVNDLISLLKQGYFDEPDLNEEGMYSSLFADDKDEELDEDEELWEAKSNLISALQEALDQENTRQALLNTNFPEVSSSEFAKYAKECKDLTSVQDRAAFNNDYKGAGDICFEFNKALRFGFQKYYQLYPQYKNSPYLNPVAITDRAKKLDNLTNSIVNKIFFDISKKLKNAAKEENGDIISAAEYIFNSD